MSDLEFLKELRENVVKGKSDITRHEMALEMIDDWIKEFSRPTKRTADLCKACGSSLVSGTTPKNGKQSCPVCGTSC